MVGLKKDKTLENFINEFFPVKDLFKAGFFTKEMKGDYEAMAKRICEFFDYETVYEYRLKETRAHISYGSGMMPINSKGELESPPFITVFKSWLDL